jgi:hypothetical protein
MDGSRGEGLVLGVGAEEGVGLARGAAWECVGFLRPLLAALDQHLDLRLVRTVANVVMAMVANRNRAMALLLSELGEHLAGGPQHGPAGTKRIDRLIHSDNWRAEEVEDHLLDEAGRVAREEGERAGEGMALLILDGSVIEKAESSELQGLAPVRSAKARRLERPRPKMGKGYFVGKPAGPKVVPGFEWVCAVVTGLAARQDRRPLALAGWKLYSKPKVGEDEDSEVDRAKHQEAAADLLGRVAGVLGQERLLHVWDRGLSGSKWLSQALDEGLHFLVRWKKSNKLRPMSAPSTRTKASPYREEQEGILAWKLTAGLKAWGHGIISNPRKPDEPLKVSYAARQVRMLHRDDPLWLIVVRRDKATKPRRGGSEPWRLLTTEPVRTAEECWRIVLAYAARWNVEQTLRYSKSELGIESVRVRGWEPRRKLLALLALAYAFLLRLLALSPPDAIAVILRWAHRTGRQANGPYRSLYRLRSALSNLWNKHTPSFQGAP